MNEPHGAPLLPGAEGGRRGPFDGPIPPKFAGLSDEERAALRRAKVVAMWVGLVLPVAIALSAGAVLMAWLPFTPNPVATHWSGGTPDGFSDPRVNVIFGAGLSGGLALLMGLPAVLGSNKATIAAWSGMNRFLAAFSLMMTASVALLIVLMTYQQLGLADARDAAGIGGVTVLAFGIGAVLGIVGFFLQPRLLIAGKPGAPVSLVPLAATERAVWVGRAQPARVFMIAIGVIATAMVLGIIGLIVSKSDPVSVWIMLGTTVFVLLLVAPTTLFRVRIDADGLEARSAVGLPVFRVPANDIAEVASGHISPMSEFGGWGVRWAPGRLGIVLRTGEGLIITRKDGRIFAVTIADSVTAAGLLETYAGIDTK